MPSCTAITVPTLAVSTSCPPKPVMLFSMMALISSAQVAIVVPPRFQDFFHPQMGEAWVNRAAPTLDDLTATYHGRGGPCGRPGRHYAYLLYFAGLNCILLGRTQDPIGGSSL